MLPINTPYNHLSKSGVVDNYRIKNHEQSSSVSLFYSKSLYLFDLCFLIHEIDTLWNLSLSLFNFLFFCGVKDQSQAGLCAVVQPDFKYSVLPLSLPITGMIVMNHDTQLSLLLEKVIWFQTELVVYSNSANLYSKDLEPDDSSIHGNRKIKPSDEENIAI